MTKVSDEQLERWKLFDDNDPHSFMTPIGQMARELIALRAAMKGPVAWMVTSKSVDFKGLYYFDQHARDMMKAKECPKDAELRPLYAPTRAAETPL